MPELGYPTCIVRLNATTDNLQMADYRSLVEATLKTINMDCGLVL